MKVHSLFRGDSARRYEEVQGGLKRMSIAKFERIIRGSEMDIDFFKVYVAKGLPLLDKVPVARELFASAATAILRKPASQYVRENAGRAAGASAGE